MDRVLIVAVIVAAVVSVAVGEGVVCPMCDPAQCPQLNCTMGLTTMDTCECCQVCLRHENERCGGPFDMNGVCEEGLSCNKTGYFAPQHTIKELATGRCVHPPAPTYNPFSLSWWRCVFARRCSFFPWF